MPRRVITLYQPPSVWGMPCPSPFGTKVETYLRMAGLPYVRHDADPRKGPKRKYPWIVDDGVTVCDSSDILDHLKAKYGDPVDAALTPEQRAIAQLARRTVEEHLYWVLVYSRWLEPAGYAATRDYFKTLLPPVIAGFLLDRVVRKQIGAQLTAQGVGRHSPADIYRRGCEDLTALAVLLGDRPFLLGDQPTSVDATLYGLTAGLLLHPADNPIKRHLAAQANLVAYTGRMYSRFFGEHPPGRSKPA